MTNQFEKVPFADLGLQHEQMTLELNDIFRRLLSTSRFILGDETAIFEEAFARYCDVGFAIGCGNGTDALEMVLEALNVGPGDEVITVSHTFVATVEAVARRGAIPRFVDVNADDLLLDVAAVDSQVTARTKAIIAVHLYGACVDMPAIVEVASRHGLSVIEDAAQAHGATIRGRRAGSWGDAATFSFYPGKNLGAIGDAGAVVTSNPELATNLRMLRDHGRVGKYEHSIIGRNSRMDGLQAAVLRAKLDRLDGWNARRRQIAARYTAAFSDLGGIEPVWTPANVEAVHHVYVALVDERDQWRKALDERGVATGIHYPIPVHLQPAFRHAESTSPSHLPVTESAAERVLSLPIFAEQTDDQVDRVIEAVADVAQMRSRINA